jgi:hypothetical protein
MREYVKHLTFKVNCKQLDRSFGSDWNTCMHKDNPTAIMICSAEFCPRKGIRDATFDLRHGDERPAFDLQRTCA